MISEIKKKQDDKKHKEQEETLPEDDKKQQEETLPEDDTKQQEDTLPEDDKKQVIARNKELKVAIISLARSIPNIVNLQVIVLFFVFLFAIL